MTAPDPRPLDYRRPLPDAVITRAAGLDDPDQLNIAPREEGSR